MGVIFHPVQGETHSPGHRLEAELIFYFHPRNFRTQLQLIKKKSRGGVHRLFGGLFFYKSGVDGQQGFLGSPRLELGYWCFFLNCGSLPSLKLTFSPLKIGRFTQ